MTEEMQALIASLDEVVVITVPACTVGEAHYWHVDSPDKHPSSKVLHARCKNCGVKRDFLRNPTGPETPTERRMTGLISGGIW